MHGRHGVPDNDADEHVDPFLVMALLGQIQTQRNYGSRLPFGQRLDIDVRFTIT